MKNDENTKYLKSIAKSSNSIAKNMQFLFYVLLASLFGAAGYVALQLG